MSATGHPSQEKLKLLGELSAAGSQLKEGEVLGNLPQWKMLVEQHVISAKNVEKLEKLHHMSTNEQVSTIMKDTDYIKFLFDMVAAKKACTATQYYLTLFYQVIRTDTSILDLISDVRFSKSLFDLFYDFLVSLKASEIFLAEKASFILTSLCARKANTNFATDVQIKKLISSSVNDFHFSPYGRLDCLKNLMKFNGYREWIWDFEEAKKLIETNLESSKDSGILYLAVFCCWLLTFNKDLIEPFTNSSFLIKICAILRESKTEKVVRTCIHTLLNCLPNQSAVESLIQQNCVHTLTLMEYEKWRDPELYSEIRDGLAALQHKVKEFNNFERYLRELNSGKLSWSFLHSEKFWYENVTHFEENEFDAIKKLILLLRSSDPTTLAVACYDLGEFSRLYPTGKKVIQKMRGKELVMTLMSHKVREVSREALLCTQKLMLDNWKSIAVSTGDH